MKEPCMVTHVVNGIEYQREIQASRDTIDQSVAKANAILDIIQDWIRSYQDESFIGRFLRRRKYDREAELYMNIIKTIEGE